jgi:hypothetical protein
MSERFDRLIKLAEQGRNLKDEDNAVYADSSFDDWVHQVSEHLQKEFTSELALEWQSVSSSPLVRGGGYYNDDRSWLLFNNAINQRLAWLADLPKRLAQSEIAPERIQSSAVAAGRREIQFDAKSHALVDPNRIEELKQLNPEKFDFSKLIRMCEELNISFARDSYFSAAMLTRAILDHVPPIFGARTFAEVSSSYAGSKSFKASMETLEKSSRNIADQHLHCQIRSTEILPNAKQVNFGNDLDVLLSEIVRINKSRSLGLTGSLSAKKIT